jgi:arsenite methyltransferase
VSGDSRRAKYGIDAPGVPFGLTAGGVILVVVAIINAIGGTGPLGVLLPLVGAIAMFTSSAIYLHTTLRGKFDVWAGLLDGLELAGDERVLDLGCGRGAVLVAAAQRLPRGTAVGVDLWRSVDQSGNSTEATASNAAAAGVTDSVELHTGDMTALPFSDGEFDVVVSSLAIHNIGKAEGRQRAIDEAVRVLRPGGRLVIADILHVADYARRLRDVGSPDVVRRPLGWRFWYGGPWMAASLVSATRPD